MWRGRVRVVGRRVKEVIGKSRGGRSGPKKIYGDCDMKNVSLGSKRMMI